MLTPDRAIAFSIASAPTRSPIIELHFRPVEGNDDARIIEHLLQTATQWHFDGPFGDVWVEPPVDEPLTIIAGGTGISQAHAIVEHLQSRMNTAPIRVVWSLVRASDAYCADFFANVADGSEWLEFQLAIDSAGQSGAIRWINSQDAPPTGTVILAGNPGFVYAVSDALTARGCSAHIHADAFSYAPR